MEMRKINFCSPDISEIEIEEVIKTLRSGWITTGPRVKSLECRLAAYIETGRTDVDCEDDEAKEYYSSRVVGLGSGTAAEELNFRILGIKPGDEVIVPAYSYTATASAAIHCGATVKFVDIQKDGSPDANAPEIDYDALEQMITEKTKAIVPVDLGGVVCDYDRIFEIVEKKRGLFKPVASDGSPLSELSARIQRGLGCVAVVADCAHSLGASRTVSHTGKGRLSSPERRYCGALAHFSSFSFHAVKNFTTGEGGAATWCLPQSVYDEGVTDKEIYRFYQLLSLHGQSSDALAKSKAGTWEYDVIGPWYKCNMTDITAAIGHGQLDRYLSLLSRRAKIMKKYEAMCEELGLSYLIHHTDDMDGSNHLFLVRIPDITEGERNDIIKGMSKRGIPVNVHFKPMPMMTAYKEISGGIDNYPCAYDYYHNLITLPVHTLLSDEDVDYVCANFKEVLSEIRDRWMKRIS